MAESTASELEQRIVATERLRLLKIGYYVKGGVTVVFATFFICYSLFLFALSFVATSESKRKESTRKEQIAHSPVTEPTSLLATPKPKGTNSGPPPAFFGIFGAIMSLFALLGWIFGGLTIYAGRCIQTRKHYVFILIMAALNCFSIPWGTFLGVCTIIVLQSPAAQAEFKTGVMLNA